MGSVLREDSTSMSWRVGAGSKSHPWWKPCSVFPLFILDNSCTYTCLLLLSHLECSPDLRNIRVRAEDIILEFDGKFMGMELAIWLVTSSSLPLRTLCVAFSLDPFPRILFHPLSFPPAVSMQMNPTEGLGSGRLLVCEPHLLLHQCHPMPEALPLHLGHQSTSFAWNSSAGCGVEWNGPLRSPPLADLIHQLAGVCGPDWEELRAGYAQVDRQLQLRARLGEACPPSQRWQG